MSGHVLEAVSITLLATRFGITTVGEETCTLVPCPGGSMEARGRVQRVGFVLPIHQVHEV